MCNQCITCNKKMEEKKHYTSPVTQRATIELEGGFCGSIYGPNPVKASEHETGRDIDFGGNDSFTDNAGNTFTVSDWN